MLPAKHRLKASKDFARIFGKGRPQHHRFFILKTVKNRLDHTRVGFVVSGKVAKKAVERNRIKRRMRSIVMKSLDRLVPGVDIVIIAKKEAIGCDFSELAAAIVYSMKKAGVIKDEHGGT